MTMEHVAQVSMGKEAGMPGACGVADANEGARTVGDDLTGECGPVVGKGKEAADDV